MRKTADKSHGERRGHLKIEYLKIDGRAVELGIKLNPRARRLMVKVHPTSGAVMVIAPTQRSLDRALEFARSESDWIARQLAKVPSRVSLEPGAKIPYRGVEHTITRADSGPAALVPGAALIRVGGRSEHMPRRVADFLKRQAKHELQNKSIAYAAKLGLKPGRITVRDTASRWGSCSSTGSLSFSWRLILAPPFVLDYVVAHEVAHLKEMNHGPRFWSVLHTLVDDVATPQAWLRRHGTALHRYAAQ